MGDGIAKGIGEQLGQLGKQVATDIAKLPGVLTGLDTGSTNEAAAKGTGGAQPGQKAANAQDPVSANINHLARQDEIAKQRELAQARQLIQRFLNPQEPAGVKTPKEQMELEELEKKKLEIEEEKKQAKAVLQPMATKAKRGNLFGIKSKQFGGEVGKNVKSQ
ncbi:MAG: hypothetical protein AAB874_07155 [Patescibacteria group bacterium]